MVAAPKIAITPRRREALVQVDRGVVEFTPATADFSVENVIVGGWDRRTFADLYQVGLITYSDGRGNRQLRLTKAGERALKPVEAGGDTPVTDSP